MAIDLNMSNAWREAGSRLMIRVMAPFRLSLPDGTSIEVEAYLPDFGGPRGAIAVSLEDDARAKRAATGPHYVSQLGRAYSRFDEELFRTTLDDWGWFGPQGTRPIWYTGQPWS